MKIENISEIWDGTNWTKTGNFVIPNENEADAVCYHIRKDANGNFYEHKHTDSGEETVDVDGDGVKETVQKEDNQHIMIPFRQMCAGYGWGASHEYMYKTGGEATEYGVKVLDFNGAASIVKFESLYNNGAKRYDTGANVKLGDLFKQASEVLQYPIDADNVQVTVSPADENSTVSAVLGTNEGAWTDRELTFTGHGYAQIIIQDYHFCQPTYLYLYIDPTVELELVAHPVNTYTENGNEAHAEATKVYVYASADTDSALTLSGVSFTVPSTWTTVGGADVANDTWTGGAGIQLTTWTGDNKETEAKSVEKTPIATFLAPANVDVSVDDLDNVTVSVQNAKGEATAVTKTTLVDYGTHNTADWIAWGDDASEKNTLPKTSGRYYLVSDIFLSEQTSVSTIQNIELCLNGHTVSSDVPLIETDADMGYAEGVRDRVYTISRGAKLTICDCSASGASAANGTGYSAGKITGAHHGAIMIPTIEKNTEHHAETVFNLYDGIITGNELTATGGSVLTQQGSTFNMYGGLITANINKAVDKSAEGEISGQGAGVYVGGAGSTFNMYGGWITNNVASRGAGIIAMSNTNVNITNGYFANNTTWQDNSDAYLRTEKDSDFVSSEAGSQNVYYTYNPNNRSTRYAHGGAIHAIGATLNITNTTFENNSAWMSGGAIYVTSSSSVTISGGTFIGNRALTKKYVPVVTESTATVTATVTETNTTDGEVGSGTTEEGDTSDDGTSGVEGDTTGGYRQIEESGRGGAVQFCGAAGGSITGTRFLNNYARNNAGAVGITTGSNVEMTDVVVQGNTIESNGGAGVYIAGLDSSLVLQGENTEITGNYGIGYTDSENFNAVGGLYLTNGYSDITIMGSPDISGNGFKKGGTGDLNEKNIYLQDNTGRIRTTTEPQLDENGNEVTDENGKTVYKTEPVRNAKIKIRNLTEYTSMSVWCAGGTTVYGTLSDWLDWKDETSDYGTWSTSYMPLLQSTMRTYTIWEDTINRNLCMEYNHGKNHADEVNTWKPWYSTNSLPTESGYYCLTADVTLSAAQTVSGTSEVTLCLNGHDVTTTVERIYSVAGTASLTVCDCTVAAATTETATVGTLYTGTGDGGAIYAQAGTTVNLENIQILGKNGTEQTVSTGDGGAICADGSAVIKLLNVRIANTQVDSDHDGGAIRAEGTNISLEMTNVQIENCQGGVGAAVYFNGLGSNSASTGTLAMTNVSITGCTGTAVNKDNNGRYGEVLYIFATESSELDSCTITGNTNSSSVRGIVYLARTTTVMRNCVVTGNSMTFESGSLHFGAVYLTSTATLILDGNNNSIYDNYLNNTARGKHQANIFLQSNSGACPHLTFRNITAENYTAAYISSDATVAAKLAADDGTYFRVEDSCTSNFVVMQQYNGTDAVNAIWLSDLTNGKLVASGHSNGNAYHTSSDHVSDLYIASDQTSAVWTPWTSATTLPNTSGNYYLTCDVALTARAEIDSNSAKHIVLCLNGFTIDASKCKSTWASVYYVRGKEHKLTICDCSDSACGKITGAGYSAIGVPSGQSYDNTGTVITVRNVEFFNNISESASGCAIIVQKYADLVIDNCTFTGNKAIQGGAVYVTNGNLTISGSTFSGNAATTGKGGAIYFDGSGKTFALNGGVNVSDNTAIDSTSSDIYVGNGTFTSTGENTIGTCNKEPASQ